MRAGWEWGPFGAEPLKPPVRHFHSCFLAGLAIVEGKILPGSSFLETSSGLSVPLRAAGRGEGCAGGWWGQATVEAEQNFLATP